MGSVYSNRDENSSAAMDGTPRHQALPPGHRANDTRARTAIPPPEQAQLTTSAPTRATTPARPLHEIDHPPVRRNGVPCDPNGRFDGDTSVRTEIGRTGAWASSKGADATNDNNLPGDGYGNTSGIKSHDAETDPSHGSPRGEVGWERHAQRTNGAAGNSSRIDSALRRKYGGWGSFG